MSQASTLENEIGKMHNFVERRYCRNSAFASFLFALLLYLSLAIGGIGLGEDLSAARLATSGPIAIFAMVMLAARRKLKFGALILGLIALSYCLFQLTRSNDLIVALRKIDGFIFASSLVLLFGGLGLRNGNRQFYNAFIAVALVVLVATLVFKGAFGFWDRRIRFFLNGPIVFGWMMAVSSIISIYCAFQYKNFRYYVFAAMFFLALIWTASKGPVVGWISGVTFLLFIMGRISLLPLFLAVTALTVLVLHEYNLLPERFLVVERLLTGALREADFGSVGVRWLMILDSFTIFFENSLIGVGLGNWADYASYSSFYGGRIVYPHNLLAEILSEHGIFGASVFFTLFIFVFLRAGTLGRTIFASMLMSLFFTGDMGYWHFLVGLPLIIDGNRRFWAK